MTVALERVYQRAAAEVVPVLREMVSHDTTIGEHDDPAREDSAHQAFVAGYLRDLGAEVEVFEPDQPRVLSAIGCSARARSFDGRPIVWARVPGSGSGRSLLFNGHYDTVPADPIADWTTSPWQADIRDGRLYGRGSCDMKGGIAAALAMAHALVAEGVALRGDLLFNVVPFEEVNGMGTIATMLPRVPRGRRGLLRADRAQHADRLPRDPARRTQRDGPLGPRGDRPAAPQRGRWRQRDRQAGRPARRAPPARRGVAPAAQTSSTTCSGRRTCSPR